MKLSNSQILYEEIGDYEVMSNAHAITSQATSAGHGQPLSFAGSGITSEGYTLTSCPAYSTTTFHAAQNSAEEEYATVN